MQKASASSPPPGKSVPLTWDSGFYLSCFEYYTRLTNLLARDNTTLKAIAQSIDVVNADSFAKVVVSIFNLSERTLPFLKRMIYSELEKATEKTMGSVMRANNVTTNIGQAYLTLALGDYVISIITDQNLDLEIDPDHCYLDGAEKLSSEQIEANFQTLKDKFLILLGVIFNKQLLDEMPRHMRAIAGYTYEAAHIYARASELQLVGGFVILRVFAPALVSPDVYHIIPNDIPVSRKARRNLVILAKVLLALSNGVIGSKEAYMNPMKPFFEEIRPNGKNLLTMMQDYLYEVAQDPKADAKSGKKAWGGLENIEPKAIDARLMEKMELFELHRLLNLPGQKALAGLTRNDQGGGWRSAHSQTREWLVNIIDRLGPSPLSSCFKTDVDMSSQVAESQDFSSPSVTPQEVKQYDAAKFFFQGTSANSGLPVLYLICSRLTPQHFTRMNKLIAYLIQVAERACKESPYELVIDVSWGKFSTDVKKNLYNNAQSCWKAIPKALRKNVKRVYFVHPNAFIDNFVFVASAFLSKKAGAKITKIYTWKQLNDYIKPFNQALPELSRAYCSRAYLATKINSRGRRQQRVIKFTMDSLLNIDPKSRTIKNEVKLADIAKINGSSGSCTIELVFTDEFKARTSGSSDRVKGSRVYEFDCVQTRDEVLCDIYDIGFEANVRKYFKTVLPQQEFMVSKMNRKGKQQPRLLKLTIDSVMNINGAKIQTEFPLSGIESVSLDPRDNTKVDIKLKGGYVRSVFTGEAQVLLVAIQEKITTREAEEQRIKDRAERELYASVSSNSVERAKPAMEEAMSYLDFMKSSGARSATAASTPAAIPSQPAAAPSGIAENIQADSLTATPIQKQLPQMTQPQRMPTSQPAMPAPTPQQYAPMSSSNHFNHLEQQQQQHGSSTLSININNYSNQSYKNNTSAFGTERPMHQLDMLQMISGKQQGQSFPSHPTQQAPTPIMQQQQQQHYQQSQEYQQQYQQSQQTYPTQNYNSQYQRTPSEFSNQMLYYQQQQQQQQQQRYQQGYQQNYQQPQQPQHQYYNQNQQYQRQYSGTSQQNSDYMMQYQNQSQQYPNQRTRMYQQNYPQYPGAQYSQGH